MREFSSIEEIAEADVERLAQVPGITAGAAEEIYRYFHKETEEPAGGPKKQETDTTE